MFLQEAFSVGDLTHWTGSIYDFMAVCQWIGYLSMSVSKWFSKSKFCAFSFFENCKMQHLFKPPHNSERRKTLFILLSSYLNETFFNLLNFASRNLPLNHNHDISTTTTTFPTFSYFVAIINSIPNLPVWSV